MFLAVVVVFLFYTGSMVAQERDLYSDTWVASDALGRKMPTFEMVGPVKKDQRQVVGVVYIT